MTPAGGAPSLPSSSTVDHLVYATPSLADGVARIRNLLGVEPSPGGRHPRWGTRNALVGLGPGTYLEIIGPDPDFPPPDSPRPFSIDDRRAPGLAAWAARVSPLETGVRAVRRGGFETGPVMAGSRETDDGAILRWRLTDPSALQRGGALPVLIDWGDTPHPGASLQHSLTLLRLRIRSPAHEGVASFLRTLEPRVVVEAGDRPRLAAVLEGAGGTVELT